MQQSPALKEYLYAEGVEMALGETLLYNWDIEVFCLLFIVYIVAWIRSDSEVSLELSSSAVLLEGDPGLSCTSL